MSGVRFAGAAFVIATSLVASLATTSACQDDHPFCYQGDYRACTCDDGGLGDASPPQGLQACLASSDDYDVCVCDGKIPGLAMDGGGGG